MVNEKSIANLKPFKSGTDSTKKIQRAGQKASTAAKAQRKTLREAYYAIAEAPYKPIGETAELIAKAYKPVSVDQAIMMAAVHAATNGNINAAIFIRNSVDGRPKQDIQQTGKGIDVSIQWDNNPYSNLTENELRQLSTIKNMTDDELENEVLKFGKTSD